MIKFLKGQSRFLYRDTAGKEHFEAMLICDTGAELAGVTEIDGAVLDFGSVAYAARDGAFYVLDSSGTWYSSEGETASLSMSPLTADLTTARLSLSDTSQPLATAESEVTADDLNVGSAESE